MLQLIHWVPFAKFSGRKIESSLQNIQQTWTNIDEWVSLLYDGTWQAQRELSGSEGSQLQK